MPIPVLQEKQDVLTKSHGKTQGKFFMDKKIEAKRTRRRDTGRRIGGFYGFRLILE